MSELNRIQKKTWYEFLDQKKISIKYFMQCYIFYAIYYVYIYARKINIFI